MAASKVIAIVRIFLNVGILAAASAVIYGIVVSTMSTADLLISGNANSGGCLLWATAKLDLSKVKITTGSVISCHFSTTAAVISILLALLLTALLIYSLRDGSTEGKTCMSCFEMIIMVANLCIAISMVITISGGLAVLCGNVADADKSGFISCKQRALSKKDHKNYFYFGDLNVAQVGAWIVACLWLVHTVFSCMKFCQYRKGKNAGAVTARANPVPGDEKMLVA